LDKYYPPREAARFLTEEMRDPHGAAYLAKLRCRGGGPTFEYFGRFPRYREDWLQDYALSRRSGPRRSTSEPRPRVCHARSDAAEPAALSAASSDQS
jgi:hypothetical protein